jgi:hypothetical protein
MLSFSFKEQAKQASQPASSKLDLPFNLENEGGIFLLNFSNFNQTA